MKNNRTYSPEEDNFRRIVFNRRFKIIEKHNQRVAEGLETFCLKLYYNSDWTIRELRLRTGPRGLDYDYEEYPSCEPL